MNDPRRVVLDLLLERGEYPARRFAAAADRAGLKGRDRAFAQQLLYGALRRQATLDALFKPFCDRPRLDAAVLVTLRIATFQRFFLERVPAYAAFDATLNAARVRLGKTVGFANGVLRAMDREAKEEQPAQEALHSQRLVAGARSFWFERPIFPDPAVDPCAYWAKAESFPEILVRRWWSAAGADRALQRMRALNEAPPLGIRVNPLRAGTEQVADLLRQSGCAVETCEFPHALVSPRAYGDVRHLPGFREGLWSVQDLAAQAAVHLAAPQPGERILDLCAAPGGKSFAAYELAGGRAEVWACDVDHERLRLVEEDRRRLGHAVQTRVVGSGYQEVPGSQWDLLILDVPCSNTGVLHKRPEARWRFTEGGFQEILAVQRRILEGAVPMLASGTRVLWTTCSLETEENTAMACLLAERAGLEIAAEGSFEPSAQRSGGYAALLNPTFSRRP